LLVIPLLSFVHPVYAVFYIILCFVSHYYEHLVDNLNIITVSHIYPESRKMLAV